MSTALSGSVEHLHSAGKCDSNRINTLEACGRLYAGHTHCYYFHGHAGSMTSCWDTSAVSKNACSCSATCVPSNHLLMTSLRFCGYAGGMTSCWDTSSVSRNAHFVSCLHTLLMTSSWFCGYAGSMTSCWQISAAPSRAPRPSNSTPSTRSLSSSSSRLSLTSTGRHTGECLSTTASDSSMPSAWGFCLAPSSGG